MKTAEKTRPLFLPEIAAGLAAILLFIILSLVFFFVNREVICEGVTIDGIRVGGRSQQQAVVELTRIMDPVISQGKVRVVYGDDSWETSLSDIGGTFDYYKAVEQAYRVGHKGSPLNRIREIFQARNEGEDITLKFYFDFLALRAFLEGVDRQIAVPPANAVINRNGQEFEITEEVQGIGVDMDLALEQIGKQLEAKDWSVKRLPVMVKIPEITVDKLKPINTRYSIFSTAFNVQNATRSENLKIAASAIEGVLLKPGDIFSFNETTGPRTLENGYMEAPVIFKGELVPGVGGGVCQVSSTLYNAVLYGNLEIVERHPHSIPSAYIYRGRDATVVYSILDLKFRNNTDGYIYLASWVEGNRIYAAIYGKEREEDLIVKIRTETVEVIDVGTEVVVDPALRVGEEVVEKETRKGYKVKTYRQIFRDNQMEKEELLSFDYYKPEKGVIRRNFVSVEVNAVDTLDAGY